ncbi:MAG: proteasome assembly chaperone family protein [Candidatus Micrarchaeia archaeon]
MKNTKIYYKKVKLNNPILIVGLPGIGSVGSLVAEHLKNELDAKFFAMLVSPHFPHQVIMLPNGKSRIVSNRFYYWKNPKKKGNDIVILLGDTQAISTEGQYEVNEKIVKFFKSLGGKRIITIGGYNIASHYVQHPRVFGVATTDSQIESLKEKGIIFGVASGAIWGSAGLIVEFAKKNKIEAACLMGETGLIDVDANAAKAVLEKLSAILGIKIGLKDIESVKKETEKLVKSIEEAMKGAEPSKENMTYIR